MKYVFLAVTFFAAASCNNNSKEKKEEAVTTASKDTVGSFIGTFEKFDPSFDSIVNAEAKAEIIADGFEWSEGALWIEKDKMLLFSDVPMNTVYKWTAEKGKEVYLKPSGYTGTEPSKSKEPGSNGLTLDNNGNLVLCQHGNRQVAQMEAPLDKPVATFKTIADKYNGKKFSSPNDCVFNNAGELFFTDPPYGLPKQDDSDPGKEQPFNGVYKVKKDGTVIILTDSITRPNGIAFFPGQKKILVASSDPQKPNWYVWDVNGDKFTNGKIFFSAAGYDSTWHGLPDGCRIDSKGNVYATGPGGIYFFNSDGKKLGMLHLTNATSNCSLSADEKTLFVTNDMYVLRIKLRN